MAKRVSVDGWLFTVTLILVFVGLVMVFSASAVMAKERYGSGYYFLLRQVGWAAAGIAAMVVAMKIDYRRYKHPGWVFSVLGATTLLLISVFFLDRAHNSHLPAAVFLDEERNRRVVHVLGKPLPQCLYQTLLRHPLDQDSANQRQLDSVARRYSDFAMLKLLERYRDLEQVALAEGEI